MSRPLKVLVLSRSYPNAVLPNLGLWVQRLVRHLTGLCQPRVISPVPYCPPLPGMSLYTRFRWIPKQSHTQGIPVYHPRLLLGPGRSLYNLEALAYYFSVRRLVARLQREFPFDVIHAHFSYPDGVAAAWLGRRYGIPVVVTEHAPWRPWMDNYPLVRRQTLSVYADVDFYVAVSRSLRDMLAHFTGSTERIRVLPNGVERTVFTPPAPGEPYDRNQILFIGFLNHNKGVDILFRAMQLLWQRRPEARLVLAGGNFYRNPRRQEQRLRSLAENLRLGDRVRFLGPQPPQEVAKLMRQSALLVLPSRAESFGVVLVEALACGTPVLATRCGGPQDIVTEDVGILVPVDDAAALAGGMERILSERQRYSPARLRNYALERFSWDQIALETVDLYHEAVAARHAGGMRRGRVAPVGSPG
jgi:teichuronic acid biosynthesis glycosyltransferase TuaC